MIWELVYSYLCDLNDIPSLENKKYFVTFIDDAFRFCYVSLLHTKDEVLDKLKVFKTKVELQQGSQSKRFRTDRGGEYIDTLYFHYDAIFDENRSSSVPKPSLGIPNETEDNGGSVVPEEVTKKVSGQHSYCFNVEDDPTTFDEAMKSKGVAFWKEAINDEMDSIIGNNTWALAGLPSGCKPLDCK
nr:zinc finger, CCHC-type [Tanacetum cinerariifolium]